jgi:hypothetical protein
MNIFGFDTDEQWSYENGFYLTSNVKRLSKAIAHYELYKKIMDLPGHVVECGVYKGASFTRLLTFREILESPHSRKIIGFDAFGKFPEQHDSADAEFIERFEGIGGEGISKADLISAMEHKGLGNYELVEGEISETLPEYLSDHPELKIALLHVDVDVYQPSVVILEHLYHRVVTGGIVVFDDYGTVAGETRAVDEFFAGKKIKIQKLSISHIPAYVVKE